MDVANHKLDVVLEANDFRLLRFLANMQRVPADDLAARMLTAGLKGFKEDLVEKGIDVDKAMTREGWG